jgi:hypothetical protein
MTLWLGRVLDVASVEFAEKVFVRCKGGARLLIERDVRVFRCQCAHLHQHKDIGVAE